MNFRMDLLVNIEKATKFSVLKGSHSWEYNLFCQSVFKGFFLANLRCMKDYTAFLRQFLFFTRIWSCCKVAMRCFLFLFFLSSINIIIFATTNIEEELFGTGYFKEVSFLVLQCCHNFAFLNHVYHIWDLSNMVLYDPAPRGASKIWQVKVKTPKFT